MDRIVLVREKNYKKALEVDNCNSSQLEVVSKLGTGITSPLGRPSHKNGAYARVINEQTVNEVPYMTLITFPYSGLDPTLTSHSATIVIIPAEFVEEATSDASKIDELVAYEKLQAKNINAVIESSFEAVFPGLWDKQGNKVMLHFPEIIIKNSSGDSHVIRDLFVSFEFALTEGLMFSPVATRTTRTYEELIAGYSHSHVGTSAGAGWQGFCFGSTVLAQTLESLRSTRITYDRLVGFLFQFDDYIHWESKEGGPYIRIADLGKIQQRGFSAILATYEVVSYNTISRVLERLLGRKLLTMLTPEDLKVRPIPASLYGKKTVELDLDRQEVIDKLIELSKFVNVSWVGVTRLFNITKGNFVERASLTQKDVDKATATDPSIKQWNIEPPLIFKGKAIHRKVVLGNINESKDKIVRILLPKYLNGIITQVNAWLSQENLLQA